MRPITRMDRASGRALNRIRKSAGIESDPDIALYKTLSPSDIQLIMAKYGYDDTIRYIKEMESKVLNKTRGAR